MSPATVYAAAYSVVAVTAVLLALYATVRHYRQRCPGLPHDGTGTVTRHDMRVLWDIARDTADYPVSEPVYERRLLCAYPRSCSLSPRYSLLSECWFSCPSSGLSR